ncbi:MAG: hypothetical protein ACKVTZ_16030 [Bacteroidia bacterium]
MKNKIIIYDDSCPMCQWYTKEFVKQGMLAAENRVGFTEADAEMLQQIDIERSRHEIPLYDTETKTTLYGPEALYCLLGAKMPMLRPLFQNKYFKSCIWQLYQIITYNRRIIAGSAAPTTGFDCAPDFNLFYRWLYILLAFTGATLIAKQVINYTLTYQNNALNISLIGISFLILLGIVMGFFLPKRISYWGHLATILLADNLLAGLILLGISFIGILPLAIWASILFALVSFTFFLMWKRRTALQAIIFPA